MPAIKLTRTDTKRDLSQKAEKVYERKLDAPRTSMPCKRVSAVAIWFRPQQRCDVAFVDGLWIDVKKKTCGLAITHETVLLKELVAFVEAQKFHGSSMQ